ncbi:MAG: DUF551 domain-containing protein [Clostridia bacterium]|nr:DUF551 domain-containing protein [Clostridia bacterium]
MTREEAIEELLGMKHIFIAESDADKALDMAIEALKAQATLDDVSNAYENGYKQGKFEAIQWISCSERLPVINEEVLVYMYGVPYIAWLDSNGEWNTETFTLREEEEAPTEWFPLPSPYKEEVEIEVKKNDK